MSNEATKKWAKKQREQELARKREQGPTCLQCGAPRLQGSAFCEACD